MFCLETEPSATCTVMHHVLILHKYLHPVNFDPRCVTTEDFNVFYRFYGKPKLIRIDLRSETKLRYCFFKIVFQSKNLKSVACSSGSSSCVWGQRQWAQATLYTGDMFIFSSPIEMYLDHVFVWLGWTVRTSFISWNVWDLSHSVWFFRILACQWTEEGVVNDGVDFLLCFIILVRLFQQRKPFSLCRSRLRH